MRAVHVIVSLVLVLSWQGSLAQTAAKDPALPPEPPPPLVDRGSMAPGIVDSVAMPRQQPPQLQQDDGFRPVSELPPEEKLPAAPLLVAAYAFVVLALFAYVLSLSRRLMAVARDIATLEKQVKRGERS